MKRERVVFCAHDRSGAVGGPYSWIAWLLPALRERGVDARALITTTGRSTNGAVAEALRRARVPYVGVALQRYTEDGVKWVLDQLRSTPSDVFVPNLSVPAYHAVRWVRRAGIPSVGVLHSDDAFYRGLQKEFVFGELGRRVNCLVCVSRYLAEVLQQRSPDAVKVRRIPYGVHVPSVGVMRNGGRLRIAYVGRMVEVQKRVTEVAQAFCRAAREVPGVEACLYGDGPARSSVERILAEQRLGDRVRFMGRIEPERIKEYLLKSHVVVLLSDYEGLPIALMEAMACGCVPVCLDIRSGVPELVRDGETGILVRDPGDDFVRAVRRLAEDQALWSRMSRAARALIEREYSDQRCADQWAELLRETARSRSGQGVVSVPRWVRLPAVNPGLAHEDRRRASVLARVASGTRRLLGRGLLQKAF